MTWSIVQSFARNSPEAGGQILARDEGDGCAAPRINLTATGLPIHLYRRTGDIRAGTEDAAVAVFGVQHPIAAQAVVEIQAGVGRHGLGRLMAAMRTDQRGPQLHLHGHRPAASRGRAQGSMKGCQARDSSTRTVATTRRPAATRDGRRQDASRLPMRRRRQCSTHPAIRTTFRRRGALAHPCLRHGGSARPGTAGTLRLRGRIPSPRVVEFVRPADLSSPRQP